MLTVRDAKSVTDQVLAENADVLEEAAITAIETIIEPKITTAAQNGADYVVIKEYASEHLVDTIGRILSTPPRNFNVEVMLPDGKTSACPIVISWNHAGYGSFKRIGLRRDDTHDYCYSQLS